MRSSSITWAPGCLPSISSLPPASLARFRGKGGKIPICQMEGGGGEATQKWSHSHRPPAEMVQQCFQRSASILILVFVTIFVHLVLTLHSLHPSFKLSCVLHANAHYDFIGALLSKFFIHKKTHIVSVALNH